MDSPDALAIVDRLRRSLDSSVIVGAGTVTEVGQINALEQVGASFIVSPHTDPALIERSRALNLEPIPGVLSPTDAHSALAAGASILKLFPAGPLGVGYLRAISAPFGGASWIPTGGIELPDVRSWLDAGALCVGIGSALWTTPDVAAEIARLHTVEAR
jgi:Entner-Doudoroff aldolase